MEETKKQIHELNDRVKKAESAMSELTESIETIEKMVAVVRDISSKTDLLALNASIEAARAGHAGKGFAVVAHEVARLSERSQESIGQVETVSNHVREKMHGLSKQLKDCAQHCSQLAESFQSEGEVKPFAGQGSDEKKQNKKAA